MAGEASHAAFDKRLTARRLAVLALESRTPLGGDLTGADRGGSDGDVDAPEREGLGGSRGAGARLAHDLSSGGHRAAGATRGGDRAPGNRSLGHPSDRQRWARGVDADPA